MEPTPRESVVMIEQYPYSRKSICPSIAVTMLGETQKELGNV